MLFHGAKPGFLRLVVSEDGIQVDEEKIKAIRDCPIRQTVTNVRNFHSRLAYILDCDEYEEFL